MAERHLELRFPAERGYLKVCRLTAMSFGNDTGLDVDQLDDLRLAVDELVAWIVDPEQPDEHVELRLEHDGDSLVVTGTRPSNDPAAPAFGDLAHAILGATADHYELHDDNGVRSFRLGKAAAG